MLREQIHAVDHFLSQHPEHDRQSRHRAQQTERPEEVQRAGDVL